MAAGSANPKRKKISLSLMCKEALCKEWGVNVHRLCMAALILLSPRFWSGIRTVQQFPCRPGCLVTVTQTLRF